MALTATISPTVTPTFGCAFTDGQNADIVLGQTNFASNTVLNPPTQASLYFPDGIATDGSNLYVCDTANSRVMEFNLATLSNGANATAEVGQANFVTQGSSGGPPYYLDGPTSDYCDGTTLYVSDASKDCVLGFKLPISTAAPAAFELGTVGVSSDDSLTMAGPMGIAEYQNGASSQLYVADSSNNRVMVYGSSSALPNGWPLSSGQPASWVIGQTGFGENSPNQGNPSPSANTLSSPFALYCDGTNLYVADAGNERVLIFPVPITGFNASASSAVIGQANANSVVNTFPAPYVLDEPWGLAGDGNYLYVDDYQLNRVLIFNLPITASLPSASTVLGQANFSSSASGDTASTLSTPEGMCSVNGSIYVSDCDNSRMLGYLCTVGDPPPEPTPATEDPLVVSISENPLIPYLGTQATVTLNLCNATSENFNNISVMLGLPATLNFVTGTATAGGTYSPATRTLDWKSGSSTAHECGAYSFKVTVAGPLTGMHQMLNIQMGAVESQNGKNFSYQESRPFTAWPWAKNAAAPALATPTPTPPFWRKLARAFEGKASGDANPLAQYLSVSKRIIAIPNPASSVMTVAFLTDLPGEAHLAFYSIDGREVFNRDLGQLAAGIGETSIPVAGLAPGVYFIDLEMNSGGGFVSAGMSKVAIVR